jgi:hypothetical protein
MFLRNVVVSAVIDVAVRAKYPKRDFYMLKYWLYRNVSGLLPRSSVWIRRKCCSLAETPSLQEHISPYSLEISFQSYRLCCYGNAIAAFGLLTPDNIDNFCVLTAVHALTGPSYRDDSRSVLKTYVNLRQSVNTKNVNTYYSTFPTTFLYAYSSATCLNTNGNKPNSHEQCKTSIKVHKQIAVSATVISHAGNN